jgi:hypothetical protein
MPGDRISWEEYQERLNAAIDDAIKHGDTGTRKEIARSIYICTAVERPAKEQEREVGL